MSKPITIVGCGPGNPELLTQAAIASIEGADVLVGAKHLLELFPAPSAEKIPLGADIPGVLDAIEARQGKTIVVLVSGDTGLFSLSRSVVKRFGRGCCQLIPGISSIQVAFARLALDWNDARIISAHGRSPQITLQELAGWNKIAVLAGDLKAQNWAAQLLEQLGTDFTSVACENLTLATERIRTMTAAELTAEPLASRTIILLLRKELLL